MPYKERNLNRIFQNIKIVCRNGNLNNCIIQEAINLYKKVSEKKLSRGSNRKGSIAASVYFACKKKNVPRSTKEIGKMFNLASPIITKAIKTFQELNRNELYQSSKPSDFIRRYCSKLKLSDKYMLLCEKVLDIIRRAGGLRQEAYPKASVLIRNNDTIRVSFEKIIRNEKSYDNFELLDGDTIIINAHPNLVQIKGEANVPGSYKFYANKNVREYIRLAGGITTDAEKNNVWINYPDGTSKQLKRFWPSPSVYDGSIITIGLEEEIEPIDKTELAKEVSSIVADFLQIYITLILLWNTAGNT